MAHTRESHELPFFEKHLGTSVIAGDNWVKGKTFNLYKHKGHYVVTNHYGNEFVNQKTYKDLKELKKDFPNGLKEFQKYYVPFAP